MPDCSAARPPPGAGPLAIRPLRGRAGLVLAGEADITTRDALRAALAALPADGAGDIHLDLTGLRFIDVCCTRELIAITERHPAVRLIAHDPPPCLRRITALLYPHASITITGRSRPDTGADGSAGPDADLAGDHLAVAGQSRHPAT
jgi:anti-anti-sigma regulatory factor